MKQYRFPPVHKQEIDNQVNNLLNKNIIEYSSSTYNPPLSIVPKYSIKDPSSRLWKWRTRLAEYDYEICYKKGTLNSNADALSRNPPAEINALTALASIASIASIAPRMSLYFHFEQLAIKHVRVTRPAMILLVVLLRVRRCDNNCPLQTTTKTRY